MLQLLRIILSRATAAIDGASTITDLASKSPEALAAFGYAAVGLGLFACYEVYSDWAGGRTLKEIHEYIRRHVETQIDAHATLGLATEELEIQAGRSLSDLDTRDHRRPWMVFFNWLTTHFEDAAQRDSNLERIFRDHADFERRFGMYLQLEIAKLRGDATIGFEDVRLLGAQLETLTRQLQAKRPPIRLPMRVYDPNEPQSRFLYSRRRTPHLGRGADVQVLWQFLDDPRQEVLWWLWTGPGGAGKSRLMYELCLEAQAQGWWAGFLSNDAKPSDWSHWNWDKPTLLIVDYVGRRGPAVAQLLADLKDRTDAPREPIRFILIDRQATKHNSWWRDFQSPESDTLRDALLSSQYQPPREITRVDEDTLWAVMEGIWRNLHKTPPPREATLQRLKEIDPEFRPLFATLFAEAFQEPEAQKWNAEDLTQFILSREVARWKLGGVDESHLHAVTLSTMIGEYTFEDLTAIRSNNFELAQYLPETPRNSLFHEITGITGGEHMDRVAPLEPDVLGECFVLNRLIGDVRSCCDPDLKTDVTSATKALIIQAWRTRPEELDQGILHFASQSTRDWHHHPGWLRMWDHAPHVVLPGWSLAVSQNFHLISEYVDPKTAESWIDQVRSLGSHSGRVVGDAYLRRGEFYSDGKRYSESIADLTHCIDLPHTPSGIKAYAFLARGHVFNELCQFEDAYNDLTSCLSLCMSTSEVSANAYFLRGLVANNLGKPTSAQKDYSRCISTPNAPASLVTEALINRGLVSAALGEFDSAIRDFSACIDQINAPAKNVAKALVNRGIAYGRKSDIDAEILDYTRCIDMHKSPPEYVAKSLLHRGIIHCEMGRSDDGVRDLTACIHVAGAPDALVSTAINMRGVAYLKRAEFQLAISEFTKCIESPCSPVSEVANAYYNRGNALERMGYAEMAIVEYTECIKLGGAPGEFVARSLVSRGLQYRVLGREELELLDYSRCIHLADAPDDVVATAYNNRGVRHRDAGRIAEAISDFTCCIFLPSVPADLVSTALSNRASAHYKNSDVQNAIADFERSAQIQGVSPVITATALNRLGSV